MPLFSQKEIGRKGELIASKYLRSRGYEILAKNWTCEFGELDLITLKNNRTVFVEVKYVWGGVDFKAVEQFTERKKRHLLRTINIFLQTYTKDKYFIDKIKDDWRLDLLCITEKNNKFIFEHLKNILVLF